MQWRIGPCLLTLVLGCGGGSDGPGRTEPEANGTPGAEGGADEIEGTAIPLGFVDEPKVRFGGQTTDFGGDTTVEGPLRSCFISRQREVSAAAARELGYDVDGDVRTIEEDVSEDVRILRMRADGATVERQTTKFHLRARVQHYWREDREPPFGVALADAIPPGCPPTLRYELIVQMFTADGAIAGTFFANRLATPLGDDPRLFDGGYAQVDLRNFTGTLPIPIVARRVLFAEAHIDWQRQLLTRPFSLSVAAVVVSDYGYRGFDAANALLSAGDSTSDAPDGTVVRYNDRILVLDELLASWVPERPNVRWRIVALQTEPSQVHVRVRVNDELFLEEDRTLVAQRDLSAAAIGDWIDLGQQDEGTRVDFEAENAFGLTYVQSWIDVDGCVVVGSEDRCQEDNCVMHSAFEVAVSACSGAVRP